MAVILRKSKNTTSKKSAKRAGSATAFVPPPKPFQSSAEPSTPVYDALYDYQKEVFEKAKKLLGCLLWMDPGTGKTPTSLAIVEHRFLRQQVGKVLVVVPKFLRLQWALEIYRWLPYANITDDPYQEPGDGELLFFICHYEWARTKEQLDRLRRRPFDMMIVDECHKLKSKGSKQSRRIALIGSTTRYRLGLTGSPIEKSELDLWAQMRFVDHTVFGKSYTEFKPEWTRQTGYMGHVTVLDPDKRTKFLNRVKRVACIVAKKDALDLPRVTDTTVTVRMEGRQLAAYQQMEREMVVEWRDVTIPAPLVVTQMIRLQQLSGGYITDEDGVDHHVGNAKLDALQDIIQGHRAPLVIYCRFKWEIAQVTELVRSLQRRVSVVSGKVKIGNHTDFDVLVMQVMLAVGLDGIQHVASTGVFYSKTFSKTQLDQAKARLDRVGQKNKINFIHLTCENTIDIDLEQALLTKRDTIMSVLNFIRERSNGEDPGGES